jgi:hypothetical protein
MAPHYAMQIYISLYASEDLHKITLQTQAAVINHSGKIIQMVMQLLECLCHMGTHPSITQVYMTTVRTPH